MPSCKVTILGTGTSQGVPVITCTCPVCTSTDPKDNRMRSAVWIAVDQKNFVIDIGPDFRTQMLQHKVPSLDGILITHEHNDHVAGLDDIRPYYFIQRTPIPLYTLERVGQQIQKRFSYFFQKASYPGVPKIDLNNIVAGDIVNCNGLPVEAIKVQHGILPIIGFIIGPLVYITDAKSLDAETIDRIKGMDILILNALHHKRHHSHLNLEEAIELSVSLQANKCYFTHISHLMGLHTEVNETLPNGIELAYDGLSFSFDI